MGAWGGGKDQRSLGRAQDLRTLTYIKEGFLEEERRVAWKEWCYSCQREREWKWPGERSGTDLLNLLPKQRAACELPNLNGGSLS